MTQLTNNRQIDLTDFLTTKEFFIVLNSHSIDDDDFLNIAENAGQWTLEQLLVELGY